MEGRVSRKYQESRLNLSLKRFSDADYLAHNCHSRGGCAGVVRYNGYFGRDGTNVILFVPLEVVYFSKWVE